MNKDIVFAIIVVSSLVLFAIIKKRLFKRSFVKSATLPITISNTVVVIISYYVGMLSLSHAIWGAPILLGAILLSYIFLQRNLNKPLSLIKDILFELSKGEIKLKDDVTYDKDDEIGDIFKALKQYQSKLQQIVGNVAEVSESIHSTGDVMRTNSVKLNSIAFDQSSSTLQISNSIHEVESSVLQNSANADKANRNTQLTTEKLYEIHETSKKNQQAVETIIERISVVNSIAFQTNILALNASIEAARAGIHGESFAVVAEEVHKLAQLSSTSAKEISDLSKTVIETTLATSKLIANLIPSMEQNAALVSSISKASAEQQSEIGLVSQSMNSLNQVTHLNADVADKLSISSAKLSEQAIKLEDAVSFFKV